MSDLAPPATDESAVDQILKAPETIAATIRGMLKTGDPRAAITQEEADQLAADIKAKQEEAKTSKKGKQAVGRNEPWSPRGEGPSGLPKNPLSTAPPPVDILDNLEELLSDESEEVHSCVETNDNDEEAMENDSNYVSPEASQQLTDDAEVATVDDLNDLAESLDAKMGADLKDLGDSLRAEINQLRTLINSQAEERRQSIRTVNDCRTEVKNLAAKMLAGPTTTTFGPVKPEAQQPAKGQKTRRAAQHQATASVGSIEATSPAVEKVTAFLVKNPAYLRVRAVRRAKLTELAKELGFTLPTQDLVPAKWDADGVLAYFSSTKK